MSSGKQRKGNPIIEGDKQDPSKAHDARSHEEVQDPHQRLEGLRLVIVHGYIIHARVRDVKEVRQKTSKT